MKYTVFLPQTRFALKANLPENEPKWLAFWDTIGLYSLQQKVREKHPLKVLNDGPPFANGHIHVGHALNKTLKDIFAAAYFMDGYKVSFVPGWDCHGLPIEAKIEEDFRKRGVKRQDIPPVPFRQECRDFAAQWVEVQQEEMKRLGVIADFERKYVTMTTHFEAGIVEAFFTILKDGHVVYRTKPVAWSPVEETTLAEAEIEYKDITSRSLYVCFPVRHAPSEDLQGASVVIWTTTPWTLPGNRAVCFSEKHVYELIEVIEALEALEAPTHDSGEASAAGEAGRALVKRGQKLLLSPECLEKVCADVGIEKWKSLRKVEASEVRELRCAHPMALLDEGYGFEVPLLPGEHVTMDSGTGFVHTAPGHGPEDFAVGQRYQLEVPDLVDAKGLYRSHTPLFAGKHIWKVGEEIEKALSQTGALLGARDYRHSYPHSWRSHTPLIYRVTPQWFIEMDGPGRLREKALEAIPTVQWFPPSGQKRIASMVQGRPDWCISRQRLWGVPLFLIVDEETQKPVIDEELFSNILARIREEGTDFWFSPQVWQVLPKHIHPQSVRKIDDILDVWFESGVVHWVVLKKGSQVCPHGEHGEHTDYGDIHWPGDVCVEGSDQHRGWFQLSLMTAMALDEKARAPYRQVVTHGFVLDQSGNKMSKSLGNVVSPQEVVASKGADILRLWIGSCDASEDLRIGPEIMRHCEDMYRRFRNTLRYVLGGLGEFLPCEAEMEPADMPCLERWIHHRLEELARLVKEDFAAYRVQAAIQRLHHFCSTDLSAFYFDIRKDSLYCDALAPHSSRRMAVRRTFMTIASFLCAWLAPVLRFTAEEAFCVLGSEAFGIDHQCPLGDQKEALERAAKSLKNDALVADYWCVHLTSFPKPQALWRDETLDQNMLAFRTLRRCVTTALERARAEKIITSSLQAAVTVRVGADSSFSKDSIAFLEGESLADMCLTSEAVILESSVPLEQEVWFPEENVGVRVSRAPGEKCERCWKVLVDVSQEGLCQRCKRVIA